MFRTRPTDIDIQNMIKDGEGREWKSGRGKKYGSGRISPSFIIGWVDTLFEKGKAKNIHAAFPEIAEVAGYESGTGGGSDYVKKFITLHSHEIGIETSLTGLIQMNHSTLKVL